MSCVRGPCRACARGPRTRDTVASLARTPPSPPPPPQVAAATSPPAAGARYAVIMYQCTACGCSLASVASGGHGGEWRLDNCVRRVASRPRLCLGRVVAPSLGAMSRSPAAPLGFRSTILSCLRTCASPHAHVLTAPASPAQSTCHAPADPYIEFEATMIFVDLLLLRRAAYRHVLTNRGPFLEVLAAARAEAPVGAPTGVVPAARADIGCCARRQHRTGIPVRCLTPR